MSKAVWLMALPISSLIAACDRPAGPAPVRSATPSPPAASVVAPQNADDDAVRQVAVGVAHHIDAKRWSELEALYADEVETDYTSLFGGTAQKQEKTKLIGGWKAALERVATQHLLGPINVQRNGAAATASCHVRALHQAKGARGGELWEVLGHYVFELSRDSDGRWKIRKMTLLTQLQTGNPKLLAEASAKK